MGYYLIILCSISLIVFILIKIIELDDYPIDYLMASKLKFCFDFILIYCVTLVFFFFLKYVIIEHLT